MCGRNNSISSIRFIYVLILLTSIFFANIQPAAGRGNPNPRPTVTLDSVSALEESKLQGGIGMGTWDTKAEFKDILIQTGDGKILFQPNLYQDIEGWQKSGGEWAGESGILIQTSRTINSQIIYGQNTWADYTYTLKARRTEGTEGFLIIFAAQDSKNLYWWNIGGWGNTRTAIEKMTRSSKREIPGTAVDLRIETGTWYDIKIAIYGKTADCYFNGKLITRINQDKGSSSLPEAGPPTIINNGNGPEPVRSGNTINTSRTSTPRSTAISPEAPAPTAEDVINKILNPVPQEKTPEETNRDLTVLHGGIGMGTWDTKAEFKDILVKQTDDKILLQSHFANGLEGWQSSGGEWSLSSDVLNQSSRSINCQIIRGENTWTDYTYSLKAKRTDGTEGFLIIFAAQDGKNLYWWNIGGWGNTRTVIEKMTRGGKREISGTAVKLQIETGIWYDIKIALRGNTAECYFNDRLITTIKDDVGKSTLPDAGPPTVVNNGNGPQLVNPILRTTTPVIIPDISPTPKLDNPASWIPKANGCLIEQTGSKIHIIGTNNIDGWGNGNGVISTGIIPAGDFYARVCFIVRQFGGSGNSRVYFRAVSSKNNGKMVAVVYDPKADTFQLQGWGVNGEPNTITQPIQKAGNIMSNRWLTLQYDSKNKTISSTAASDRYLGTIDYDLSDPVRFELLADADTKGMQIDVEFNYFSVTTDRLPAMPDRLTGRPIEKSTTRRWVSPNGKHAIQIVENVVNEGHGDTARGPIIFLHTMTYVTGLAIDPNGTASKQWDWTEPQPPRNTSLTYSSYITLQVADVLVGDSGNRSVLLGRFSSRSPRAFQRVIVILDDKGKIHSEVTADNWLKALGQDSEITSDKPPKLQFLDNEKILEIKLASGRTARVNTDTGDLFIE